MLLQFGLFATPVGYGLDVIPRELVAGLLGAQPAGARDRRLPAHGAARRAAPARPAGDRGGVVDDRPRRPATWCSSGWRPALPMSPDGTIAATDIWKRFRADPTRQSLRARGRAGQAPRRRARAGGAGAGRCEDVDFVVEPGESVGLVGINGSGKSTLLKILTRVMYPYAGRVDVGGPGRRAHRGAGRHPPRAHRPGEHPPLRHAARPAPPGGGLPLRRDRRVRPARGRHRPAGEVLLERACRCGSGFGVAAFLEPRRAAGRRGAGRGRHRVPAALHRPHADDAGCRGRRWCSCPTTWPRSRGSASGSCGCTTDRWRQDGPARDVLTSYRQALEQVAEVGALRRRARAGGQGPGGRAGRRRRPHPGAGRGGARPAQRPRQAAGRVCIGFSEGPASPIFLLRHDVHLPDDDDHRPLSTSSACPLPRGRYYLWLGVFHGHAASCCRWQPVAHFDVIGPDLDAGPAGIARLSPVHVAAHWDVGRE